MLTKLRLATNSTETTAAIAPKKVLVYTDSTTRTVNTGTQTIVSSGEITLKANKSLKLYTYVPIRRNTGSSKALIIRTDIWVNKVHFSLGNSGEGNNSFVNNSRTIASYTHTSILSLNDIINQCNVAKDASYTLTVDVTAYTVSGDVYINRACEVNRASRGQSGTTLGFASNQNHTTLIIKEI